MVTALLWRRYSLHGLTVDVHSDSSPVTATVHGILEHLGLVPSDMKPNRAGLTLRLSSRSQASVPVEAQEIAQQDGIRAWSDGCRIYLTCDGHAIRLHPQAGVGDGVLPSEPSIVRKDVLIYSLLLLLRRRGFYGLHASGVSREGAGYLFVADRGSGKSTHSYSLVRQRWKYLGDDAVLLRPRDGLVEALALRRDLCLDPRLARHFPEVGVHGEVSPFVGKNKRRLAMHALYPDQQIDRCVPRVILFPEITLATGSRLIPLKPAAALPRLIAQSAVFALDSDVIPRHVEVLNQLAQQARSYRLLAGQDLKEEPELIADLLGAAPEFSWKSTTARRA